MLEFSALSRGQYPSEAETIRRVALLEPFVRVMIREVQALCMLKEDPTAYGFFVPVERLLSPGNAHVERTCCGSPALQS